ncbi:TonB-dependent receptor [Lutimonas sp.]|uniref:TonB-dependent receptor n=1 Tax=Lutimonas sp. TaxID=1872403 RepID=UPI003D9B1AF6
MIQQSAGQRILHGRIIDSISEAPLEGVRILVEENEEVLFTDENGFFSKRIFLKEKTTLLCDLIEFKSRRIELKKRGSSKNIDMGIIALLPENETDLNQSMMEVSQEAAENSNYDIENISGLLSSRKDVFSRTAAFDFGSNFFRRRFLGSEQGLVMLNGVRLNKVLTGRPEWSNWGGLNDALRKQEVFSEMHPTNYALGGMAKSINMLSVANIQRKGLKLSMSAANKNYTTRLMITYATGLINKNWSIMLSASMRNAKTGYRQGTNYHAKSLLVSMDRRIGQKHHLNATFIYANNDRGRSSPMTDEVFQLKGTSYNSYWGYQWGKRRNSREKKIHEPITQLNYYFNPNPKWSIDAHVTYQNGQVSFSRLDYNGSTLLGGLQTTVGQGINPDATYYQKLPSYFLRSPLQTDYANAFLAEREIRQNGQVDWESLQEANLNQADGKNAIYALYEDVDESQSLSFKTSFSHHVSNRLLFQGSLFIRNFQSENYAYMIDLLGGKGYLDVDSFSENLNQAQNNLKEPNRIVIEKEKFRYNYELGAIELRSHLGAKFTSKKSEFYAGFEMAAQSYQRNGLYENGRNPGNLSIGKSESATFNSTSFKTGYSYRITGRHVLSANVNYLQNAPVLKSIFSNIRESNNLVENLRVKESMGFDFNYTWRHPVIYASFSGYYLHSINATNISFYYADGLIGLGNQENSAYVQEVLTGINKLYAGFEFALEAKILSGLKLRTVAALGNSFYTSDPELYLTSNSIEETLHLGESQLKGYFASSGPQKALSFGLEYSSPSYWWLSSSVNIFDNSYVSVAPITRTKNFYLDTDGSTLPQIDIETANVLLQQEPLNPYWTLNIVGGKSWKIKDLYLGFFVSLNNVMDAVYKTGGFEQSRNANYQRLLEDKTREKPLFGPKYWLGYGSTFFSSIYIRI